MAAAARFWSEPEHPFLPAWVRLSTGATAPYPGSAGVAAIRSLVTSRGATRTTGPERTDLGYYSNCLSLLAECAAAEAPAHPANARWASLR